MTSAMNPETYKIERPAGLLEARRLYSPEAQKVMNYALSFHERFNREKWTQPSFHDRNHIVATIDASRLFIEAAQGGNDPLRIYADLERWNKGKDDSQYISINELREVSMLAFACHDLGNIIEDDTISMRKEYSSKNAEDRSAQIAERIMTEFNTKTKYLPLIKDIILNTKFKSDPNKPLTLFTQVVDQIGGNVCNVKSREQLTEGILYEFAAENIPVSTDQSYNFVPRTLKEMIPAEKNRITVWNILSKGKGEYSQHLQIKFQNRPTPDRIEDVWKKLHPITRK